MSDSTHVILLVDPDTKAREKLAAQISSKDSVILHASDGPSALAIMAERPVAVLITELYIDAGENDCLIHAVRRDHAHRRTRIVAHTQRARAADREWAMRAGADAYLIKPTREQRLRYVIGRLLAARADNSASLPSTMSRVIRRDSLDAALADIEQGKLADVAAIIFGRIWWDELSPPQKTLYRERAKRGQVHLRSDSMLGSHFVEVRGPLRPVAVVAPGQPKPHYRRPAAP